MNYCVLKFRSITMSLVITRLFTKFWTTWKAKLIHKSLLERKPRLTPLLTYLLASLRQLLSIIRLFSKYAKKKDSISSVFRFHSLKLEFKQDETFH